MQVLCVDSDGKCLENMVAMCRRMPDSPQAEGFATGGSALTWLRDHAADVALLEFDLADMDGIDLARELRRLCPDIAIVFLTGARERAIDAWELMPHVQGCVQKPASQERLEAELEYALADRPRASARRRVAVKTFGGFDLFVDDRVVAFRRSKAKELLAYLVDQRGGEVTRQAAFSALWEDRYYDRSMQKYFDVIVRSLLEVLAENDAGDIVEVRRGTLRVCPEKIDCDFYRFLAGDIDVINAFRGEYMNDYSWASITEAFAGALKYQISRSDAGEKEV